jgi:predicted DNA-binding transcriptional regulator YafY
MNRVDRLLAIVLELQAKGCLRAEDLAATFEVSKRSIYRDIQALSETGVPIVAVPGQGYSLAEGYFLPPLRFTADEAIILLLGADFMAQNFDAEYRAAAGSAENKIGAVLSERLRDQVRDLQQSLAMVAVTFGNEPERNALLQQLRRAILQRKTIRMHYHSKGGAGEPGERNVREADPYGLVYYGRAWYLVAYCHLRSDTRNFRLDRIRQLTILGQTFERPPGIRLVQNSFDLPVTVRAVFRPEIAHWVREEQPFYLVSEVEQPEGVVMIFKTRRDDDLFQWLLGWGAQVQVLEPASLRQRIQQTASAILDTYKNP